MLGPFASASRRTPIHQVSLPVLSHAACASMSTTTTTTTTTRDRGDCYGPMGWAQQRGEQRFQPHVQRFVERHASQCECTVTCVENQRCPCRYDLKDTSKVVLQDTHFLCAMAPPGGGRNVVSPRFLRHFFVIGITPFSDDTMTRIFGTLLARYLRVSIRSLPGA